MDIDLIERIAEHYKQGASEPDAARLDFFERLYRLQQQVGDSVTSTSTSIYEVAPAEQLEAWYWGGRPVLGERPCAISPQEYADALGKIAAHLAEHAGLEDAAANGLQAFDWETFAQDADLALAGQDPTAFLDGLLSNVDALGVPDEVPASVFAMVPAMALRPFLENAATQVMAAIDTETERRSHDCPVNCPVCGSAATASFVGESAGTAGKGRMQYCGICGAQWPYERVRCGVCGSHHAGHLHYFNIEGDEAHRIQMCDDCGQYQRVVFQEDLDVPVCMEVEDVVMARLDKIALDPRFSKESKRL